MSNSRNQPLISKFGHGGPRANSGGARPGAGRKPVSIFCKPFERRWYCIQTEPRAELRVIHGLEQLKLEMHCPKMLVDGKEEAQLRFPGYLFVRFSVDAMAWRTIHRLPGVIRLFSEDAERPTPLRRGYVEGLLEEAGDAGFIDARSDGAADLEPGTVVRLLDGPLAGFTGPVVSASSRYVTVGPIVFGRTTPVTVARRAVELAA